MTREINPINRSSTIFPLYFDGLTRNKILYLNYWKLKNAMRGVTMQLSLRRSDGEPIKKLSFDIADEPLAAEIDVENAFADVDFSSFEGFSATLEIEIFFQTKPPINFPAMILSYQRGGDSSFVHSCLRRYDSDETANSESLNKEQTGFDVYLGSQVKNYVAFVSGAQKQYNFRFELISDTGGCTEENVRLNPSSEYQLFIFNLNEIFADAGSAAGGGRVSIKHDIGDIYPRFYVGNYSSGALPTLTHTFYNERAGNVAFESLDAVPIEHSHASFSFPILNPRKFQTTLVSYASNAPWQGTVRLEILNQQGEVELTISKDGEVLSGPNRISVNKFVEDIVEADTAEKTCKVSLIGNSNLFPVRNKFGLNYCHLGKASKGTNICFAPIAFSSHQNEKALSTLWAPIGGSRNIVFYFNNTSNSLTQKGRNSEIEIKIINKKGQVLLNSYSLKQDETLKLDSRMNESVAKHLGSEVGWCFCSTTNNYFNAWYVCVGDTHIGGDHAF